MATPKRPTESPTTEIAQIHRYDAVSHNRTCGVCRAGILIEHGVVRACPTCKLFEENSDAAEALAMLVCILDACYEAAGHNTVADVLDRIDDVLFDTDFDPKRCVKCTGILYTPVLPRDVEEQCHDCGGLAF